MYWKANGEHVLYYTVSNSNNTEYCVYSSASELTARRNLEEDNKKFLFPTWGVENILPRAVADGFRLWNAALFSQQPSWCLEIWWKGTDLPPSGIGKCF